MFRFARSAVFVAAAVAPLTVGAQTAPPAPELTVLSVFRETVKPGKGPSHDALEAAWSMAQVEAKYPAAMLAISAMTGASENWYMSGFPNWAAFESVNKAMAENPALAAIQKKYSSQEGEYLNDGRMMVLTARPDLSYGPPADLARMRYMSVQRITTRPGHTAEFEENRKITKAAHEAAKLTDRFSVWQAAQGAPTGTYFIFVARRTIAELDEAATIHGPAYIAALGGAEGQNKMNANAAAAVVGSENNIFAFAPMQSIPPTEWVTADPGYWKRKPAPRPAPKPTP